METKKNMLTPEQLTGMVEKVKEEIKEKLLEEQKNFIKKKRFFTSDLHFNDDRLNLYGRDLRFKNAKEVNEHIIETWNKTVGKNDLVYLLGDISMDRDGLEILNQLNGEKILIKGNYDISVENGGTSLYEINDKLLLKYFSKVVDELEIEIGGETIYLNHFPTNAKEDIFNICGHIHGLWKISRNMINVGVDIWHFTPVSEELIKFQMNGIRKFYDQNCFPNELIASVKNRKGEIIVLRAPEEYNVATFEENKDIFMFIAGPIQGTSDVDMWQEKIIKGVESKLKDVKINKNIVVCSPRRLEKPKDFIYEEQVEWETKYLGKSGNQGIIVFWLAKETEKIEGRSFARTTRVELGEWIGKSQNNPVKLVVGYEKGFEGIDYIEKRMKDLDPNFEMTTSIEEMIEEIVEQIKKMIL